MGASDALHICEDCKFQGIDTTSPGVFTAPRTDSVAEQIRGMAEVESSVRQLE